MRACRTGRACQLTLRPMRRKLTDNLRRVEGRLAEACARAGRDRSEVTLIAVTKTVGVDVIRQLLELGVTQLGESRVQELSRRAAMIQEWASRRPKDAGGDAASSPAWHLVGHLQRNKVKQLLPWVAMIHSVDSLRLAEEVDLHAGKLGRRIPVLLEVNAGGESQKHGVAVGAALHLAEQMATLSHVELRGVMAMAPLSEDPAVIRRAFERTREVFEEIVSERVCGPAFRELSMGMSNDFEYAIEAGATCVRIGSALFEGLLPAAAEVSAEAADGPG